MQVIISTGELDCLAYNFVYLISHTNKICPVDACNILKEIVIAVAVAVGR